MTIPNPLATAPTMAVITTSTSMDPQQYDMSDLDVLEVLRDVDEQLAGDGEIFHFPRKEIEEDGINVLTSETNDVDFIDSFVPVSPDHRDEASVDTSSSGTTASYPTPTYNNDVSEYAVAVAVAVAVPIAPRNTKKSIKAKQKADEGAKKTNANRKRKLQTEISSVPPQVVELTDEQRR